MNEEKNKGIAALAYLIFFLPLIVCKEDEFAMYHANQGLLLLIFGFGISFILGLIPILGWILLIFFPIVTLVFFFIGIMNALKSEKKPLPLIGGITILK
ncbi:hypothetical protein [Fusibacter bizertensis]